MGKPMGVAGKFLCITGNFWRNVLLLLLCSVPPLWAVEHREQSFVYSWPDSFQPCRHAFEERLWHRGFSADWQLRLRCQSSGELWWMPELRPKVRRLPVYSSFPDASNLAITTFAFEDDFFEKAREIYTETYKGPPKWMPDSLVYWDSYLGDWRYLSRPLERQVDSKSAEPELLMLTLKFEDFEHGLRWDATFDLNRFAELLNITELKLDWLWSEISAFFSRER